MPSRELTIGMIFLSQTTLGILGNFSLLYHYLFLYFTGCKLRSTDLILRHLTVANTLVILSKGIPQTIVAFGWKGFLNDFGCKLVFYVHRVGRGVSIGSTCLLNVFQAITISPRNARWTKLKVKFAKYIGPSNILCWILHMLVNMIVPIHVTGNRSNKTITKIKDFGYCSVLRDKTTGLLHSALFSFLDVVCLGLMSWTSGSMVFILHRHKKQVQHIHRNNLFPRSFPESRATKTILVLVSTFVSFYTLSSIFQACVTLFNNPSWWLISISPLFVACFPTVSPFVLLSSDSSVSRLCCVSTGKKTQFSHLIKKYKLFIYH
ncbi:vomeronasal type-1 receptor 4-like [Elephas maximus indicus]|uniref:vomeronasal type-1 receptor 4-like n=1 Tax=Elephas maximus indicus TaxID=99487 RepID=UPI0021166A92|nr:vomeronasal type-1 receptor 4-like [Elephas maximus indicus]